MSDATRAGLNLLNPRLPHSLAVLLATIGVLFGTLIYLGWTTFQELERQRARPTDSAQWALYQTSLEFHRLSRAHSDYLDSGSEAEFKEFTRRFDIFFSRVGVLNTGSALAPYRTESFYRQGVGRLTDFVTRIAGLVDRNDAAALRTDPSVLQDFEKLQSEVAAFVTAAVQSQAARDDAKRNDLRQLLLFQLTTSALVLMAFIYFTAVVVRERNLGLRREVDLRASRDLLHATVASSLDGVMIADAKGVIVEVNDAAARIFGHDVDQMLNREMSSLIMPERHRDAHRAGMERYVASGQAKVLGRRIEIDAIDRDGREFPIELSIAAANAEPATLFVAYMRDITERRAAEQNLRAARDRAEEASRAKAHFLAAMSHEMRTPLTGILGALDLIEATELDDQQQKLLRTAQRSGQALLAVISDVIDISRLEAGKMDLEAVTFDLLEVAYDVLEILGSLARQRRNEIRILMDENLPRFVSGDPARVRQVLLNLVTNAVKFTYGGRIDIEAKLIGQAAGRAEIEIAVRDNGPGIPEAERNRLFKSFSQLANAPSGVGGSGLGLAISKRLVDLMSGSIDVESALGVGSRFWFRLPLEIADAPALQLRHSELAGAQDGRDMAAKLLVVDDNETVRIIVSGLLASRGHRVETAASAIEAIELLKASAFDAIILDVSMPVMDGFEALRIIRALPGEAGQTPVIALTAHALIEDRERCIAAGFDHFLTKPVRVDELLAAVISVMSPSEPRAAPAEGAVMSPQHLLDIGYLRDQFGTVATEDLQKILERFGVELAQHQAILLNEGEGISPHHLRRIVHQLSGSSSMIGARQLAALTGRLDALSAQQRDAELPSALEELREVVSRTRDAVEERRQELARTAA